MIDTTILREARRRIEWRFAGLPRHIVVDNPGYHMDEALRIMDAIANHAENITHPEWYRGVYTK